MPAGVSTQANQGKCIYVPVFVTVGSGEKGDRFQRERGGRRTKAVPDWTNLLISFNKYSPAEGSNPVSWLASK